MLKIHGRANSITHKFEHKRPLNVDLRCLTMRAIAVGLLVNIIIYPSLVMAQKQQVPQKDKYGESIESTNNMKTSTSALIDKYAEKNRGCDDEIYLEIFSMLTVTAYLARGLQFLDPSQRKSASQVEFERSFSADVARLYLKLGQTALDKLCPKQGRDAFLVVVDTYNEPYHASIRERARIGIDDARVILQR